MPRRSRHGSDLGVVASPREASSRAFPAAPRGAETRCIMTDRCVWPRWQVFCGSADAPGCRGVGRARRERRRLL